MPTFPRHGLSSGTTPLEHLPRLSRALGGPDIHIKRDDLTGLAGGGNKVRKLEYLVADALRAGADTLIGLGATQSNHARQTAAAAARLGLRCVLLLERRLAGQPDAYYRSGNAQLNRILGAVVPEELPAGADIAAAAARLAAELTEQGHKPYVVAGGGSSPLGALGYVDCAHEIAAQAATQGFHADCIVHAAGSGGTQAGLLAARLPERGTAIRGYSVRFDRARMGRITHDIANGTAALLQAAPVPDAWIDVDDTHIGEAYGIPTPEGLAAIQLLGRLEGILLDPVYTGKAMAGLIADIAAGRFTAGQHIVFLHTGGAMALPAYADQL